MASVVAASAQNPPPPGAVPATDELTVGLLASLLVAADARRFDPAALRDALASNTPAVRRQAALAAGRMGDATAVDLLVPVLNDTVPSVAAAAAFGLGLLKDARAIPALLQTIRAVAPADQGPPQLEAVTAIAKIGGDDGARALTQITTAASPTAPTAVADAALLEAWRLGSRAPVTELLRYTDATAVTTRWHALYSLARLRAAPGAARLVRALGDQDDRIRTVAARGITRALVDSAKLDAGPVIDGLRPLLVDRDAHIRINALRALASFRDSTLSPAVVPLMADRDLGVEVQAETTLGVLRGAAAVVALRGRLTSSVFALKRQALIALAQADSAAGVGAAATVVSDAHLRWRSVAAEAFGAARARERLAGQLAGPLGRGGALGPEALERNQPPARPRSAPRGPGRSLVAPAG